MSYLTTANVASTKVQLDWSLSSDIIGTTISPTTWTDLAGTSQSFTVDSADSVVEIAVSGTILHGNNSGTQMTVRAVIDAAGTPIYKFVSGSAFKLAIGANNYDNILEGANAITLTGLIAGTHTIKLQLYNQASAGPIYCRPVTIPQAEFLNIRIVEHKVLPALLAGPTATTKVQLNWSATTDVYNNATGPAANTWQDVPSASQTFNVDDPNSVVEIDVGGILQCSFGSAFNSSCRVVIDGSSNYVISGGVGQYNNALSGSQQLILTGLSAGSHTVNLQFLSNVSSVTQYCLCSSQPNLYSLYIRVLERKQQPTANVTTGLSPNSKVQLDFSTTTDASPSLINNTWVDMIDNLSFNVDNSNSVIEIAVSGSVDTNASAGWNLNSRLVIDSAGSAQNKLLGGMVATGYFTNLLAGAGLITLTGLSAGRHTVKLQGYVSGGAATANIRSASFPNLEYVSIRVLEQFNLPSQVIGPSSSTKVQLDYTTPTTSDIFNATSLASGWNDVVGNQSFTIDDPNSVIEFDVAGSMLVGGVDGATIATRIVIDSIGTAINKLIGGGPCVTSNYPNPFSGSSAVTVTGLVAGIHTVKAQVYVPSTGFVAYLRPNTQSNSEFVSIRVLERKQTPTSTITTALSPSTRVQLNYTATTDLATALSLTANTWTDIGTNQTFIVDNASSVVEISVIGLIQAVGASNTVASRINIDSGGTPSTRQLGGGFTGTSIQPNFLGGSGTVSVTGLAVGSHTVKVQVIANGSGTSAYCRPVSNSQESLSIQVLERYNMPSYISGPAPTTKVQYEGGGASPPTYNGANQSANTLFDLSGLATFTIDDPNSIVEFEVLGNPFGTLLNGNSQSYYTIDGVTYGAGGFNPQGSIVVPLNVLFTRYQMSGLAAGSHTLKVQLNANGGINNIWGTLGLRVLERKQTAALVSNCMVKLAEVIVGAGGQATIPFSNIDQRYRNLRLVVTGRSDAAGVGAVTPSLQFNSDTGANYSRSFFQAYDIGTGNGKDTAQTSIDLGVMAAALATANVPGVLDVEIFNYTNTFFYKGCRSVSGYFSGNYNEQWITGMWASTAAITSILLFPASGNFIEGSVASLYGII